MAAELEAGAARQDAFEPLSTDPQEHSPTLTVIEGGGGEQETSHLDGTLEDIRDQIQSLRAYGNKQESGLNPEEQKELSTLLQRYRTLAEAAYKAAHVVREGEATAKKILDQGEENERLMKVLNAEIKHPTQETVLEKELREARAMTDDDMREHAAAQRRKIIEHNARVSSEHTAAQKKKHPTVEDLIREHRALAFRGDALSDEERARMETIKKAVDHFRQERDEPSPADHPPQGQTASNMSSAQERYTLGNRVKPLAQVSEQIHTHEIAIQQAQEEIAVLKKKNGGFFSPNDFLIRSTKSWLFT